MPIALLTPIWYLSVGIVFHAPFGEVDGVQSSLQGFDVVSLESFVKRHVDEGQQTLCIDAVHGAVPAHTEHVFTIKAIGESNALCAPVLLHFEESNHVFVSFRVTCLVTPSMCDEYLPMNRISVFKECPRPCTKNTDRKNKNLDLNLC